MHHHLAHIPECSRMHKIVGGVIAAVPGSFVIHQDLNPARMRGFLHGQCVSETNRKRFLHHDGNTVPGADFHDSPVIVSIGVNQHRLRMSFLKHFLQIGKQHGLIEPISCRRLGKQMRIRLGHAYDLNFRAVAGLGEKSVHMSMHQSNDSYTQRSLGCRG